MSAERRTNLSNDYFIEWKMELVIWTLKTLNNIVDNLIKKSFKYVYLLERNNLQYINTQFSA